MRLQPARWHQRVSVWQLLLFPVLLLLCCDVLNAVTLSLLSKDHCLSCPGAFPRVLFAAAGTPYQPDVQRHRIYPDEKTRYSYDGDVKPSMVPWRDLRTTLRQAGCFTTRALPRLTGDLAPDTSDVLKKQHLSGEKLNAMEDESSFHGLLVNRTDLAESPVALPAVCRKPIVLFSGRTRDCVSCNHFATEVRRDYAAEWSYIRDYVTLVDAGDPMSEQLTRFPYPLWYNAAALARTLVLTPRFPHAGENASSAPADGEGGAGTGGGHTLTEDEADYALFTAGLRQKAALLVKAPAVQAGHSWSRLVRRTFANPSEYVLRIIFIYPHNGSIMRDVVNEGIFDGSSPDYLYFYASAKHFFQAVKKAVRVMNWLERYGDY